MATYTAEPYERGGQTLTGYAAEYARALDAGASDSQAHQQANYQAGGTGITAAEMDKYGQTGYTVNPNTGYVASQYDSQSDTWRAEDARREAERQRQLELERLKQAQIAANMAQLEKSKAASLSAIKQEQAAVDPRFYESKRQTQEQSALSRRQAEEYAATKGLSSSGLAAQSQSTISGGLQSALGALGQSQAEAHARMERAKSDLETAYQSDVAGVQAGAEAQYLQNVIDQYYKDREYQLAKEQADRQFALQEAGLTGYYQGQLTAAGQQADRQFALQEAGLTGVFQGMPTMQRQEWEQAMRGNELDLQTKQFNLQQLQDPNSPVNQKQVLELQMLQLQNQYAGPQMKLQLEQLRKSIAEIGKAPYKDQQQVQIDALKIAQSQEQLNQMKLQTQQMQNPQGGNIREQAVAMAQKDPDWNFLDVDGREKLIQQYEAILKGSFMSDQDIMKYLK